MGKLEVKRCRAPLLCATLCTLLVPVWWWLTTRYNYGGNWTGLYDTGALLRVPPALESENIYRFPNTLGYDGQYYHYIAHDPAFRYGLARYIDAPRLRYQRILVPALAFAFAAGRWRAIDAAYLGVMLAFIFLGTYWVSWYGAAHGRHPAWGVMFLAVPAVIASIDNLTVDAALVALCAAFACYAENGPPGALFAVLALAPLARETGLLLVPACCLSEWRRKRRRRASVFALAALPYIGWYLFVRLHTGSYVYESSLIPFAGVARAILHPVHYPYPPPIAGTGMALEYLALAGALLGILLALRPLLRFRTLGAVEIAALIYVLVAVLLQRTDVWQSVYGFGRIFSPLFLLLALRGLARRSWAGLLPLGLMVPRTLLQLGPQMLGIWRGWIG